MICLKCLNCSWYEQLDLCNGQDLFVAKDCLVERRLNEFSKTEAQK